MRVQAPHPRAPALPHLRRQPAPAAQGHDHYRHCRATASRPQAPHPCGTRRRLHPLPHPRGPFQPDRSCPTAPPFRSLQVRHPTARRSTVRSHRRRPREASFVASSTLASTRPAAILPSTSPPAKETVFFSSSTAACLTIRSTLKKAPRGPSRPPPPSSFPPKPLRFRLPIVPSPFTSITSGISPRHPPVLPLARHWRVDRPGQPRRESSAPKSPNPASPSRPSSPSPSTIPTTPSRCPAGRDARWRSYASQARPPFWPHRRAQLQLQAAHHAQRRNPDRRDPPDRR